MAPQALAVIGHAAMDAQHQLLMTLVQRIAGLLKDGTSDDQFVVACQEFRSALATHFGAEEASLSDAAFEEIEAHRAKHRKILDDVSGSISAMALVKSTSSRLAILSEIEDHIYQHEVVDDTEYGAISHNFPTTYNWDESLSVGVEWIDEQHKNLFAMARVLGEQTRAANWSVARFVYGRLLDHIKQHFDAEEMHISHIGSDVLSHRRSHLHAILALNDVIEDGNTQSLAKIEEFIFHWLRQHILTDDIEDIARSKRG